MSRRKKFFDEYDFDFDFYAPKNPKYVTGKISVNPRGFAFVTPDEGGKDIYIAAEDVEPALHGDIVNIRITAEYGERREGEVVEVIKRGSEIFICKLKNRGKTFWAEPVDEKFDALEIHIKYDDKKYLMDLKRRHVKVVVKVFRIFAVNSHDF